MTRLRDIAIAGALNFFVFLAMAAGVNSVYSPAKNPIAIDFLTLTPDARDKNPASIVKAAPARPVKKSVAVENRAVEPLKPKTLTAPAVPENGPDVMIEQTSAVEHAETAARTDAAQDDMARGDITRDDIPQNDVAPAKIPSLEGSGQGEGEKQDGRVLSGQAAVPAPYYAAESLATPPSFVTRRAPVYPAMARRAGAQGEVVVEVWLEADGSVAKVEVVKEAGWGFGAAALDAARTSAFTPGIVNGAPVRSRVKIPYVFVLKR